jgi:beta-N-acetylhexosaminidase
MPRRCWRGNDIIEYSTDPIRAIEEIAKRVEKGEIAVSEITDRCRKLLEAKLWLEIHRAENGGKAESGDQAIPGPASEAAAGFASAPGGIPVSGHPALIRDLYAGAMTLIENNDNLLPLGRLDRIRIATVSVNRLAMTEFQR